MQIELNGNPHDVSEAATIGHLLETLEIRRDGIAVAVNLRVIPRSEHDRTTLQAGDRVEVIQAVGGG
ncbi:MAG: sulfur carrier protein ThiS [Myxococcota bacterium]|nr:sulfur carrier protein ThiS [Myxococcota bacterium]